MDDPRRWARLLDQAATERAAQPRRICQLCVEMLAVTGAGISMVTDTGLRGVVCSTDDLSARIEELQVTLGEGPCVDAVRTGAPVLVPDLDERGDLATERWPAFIEAAGTAGVRAVFAFPLRIGAIGIGALDLYRSRPGPLDGQELAGGLLAADAVALALLDLNTSRPDGFEGDLGNGPHQAQVHQATGMVKLQLDVSIEEAFLALRARAFSTGSRLPDVAADVVEGRLRFNSEDE